MGAEKKSNRLEMEVRYYSVLNSLCIQNGYYLKKNQFAIPKTNLLYNFKSNLLCSLLSFRSADVAGEQEQLVTLHY